RLWVQKKDPDAVPKMLDLLKNLDQIPEKEQYDFALQILKMLWAMGHSAESLEASKIVAAKWPDSLDIQLGIFDTAIQMDDLDTANAAKDAIQKLDKEGLFATLAEGITNLAKGEKERDLAKRDELYEQASLRFNQVLEKRQNWGWAWFLKGKLFLIQEKYTEAIAAFEKAIAHGESNPALYEHTLMLLNQKEYVSETQTLLKALSDKNSGDENDRFRRVAALLAIRQQRFAEALKTAEEVYAKLDPNAIESNANYSWLAIVYSSVVAQNIRESKTDTAEYQDLVRKAADCFNRAMQAPDVPVDIRYEQFRFMILIGQKDQIPALLEQEANAMAEGPATELRANTSLLLNDLEGANAAFSKLLQAEPYNLSYMQQAARFYTDTNRNEELIALTRTHLNNPDAPAPVKRWARQNFAIAAIVLNRTDPLLREEAKKLIEANLTESKEPNRLDLRLKAELCVADGQLASRKIALDIMTNLVKNFRPSILDEEILYGKLLMLSGDKTSTTRHFDDLRKRYPGSTDVLTSYISILLAYQDYPYARALIDKLLEQMPDSSQAIQFRLDRFFALNEYDSIVSEARKQLERIQKTNANYADACTAFGKLLLNYYRQPVAAANQEALRVLATESESCFRQALQADPKSSAAIPLASLLVRQGRIDDALKLVSTRSATSTEADCALFIVDAGAVVMSFTPEQSATMEAFIQESMTRFGHTFTMLGGLAEYRICQNRTDEAEKLYQEGVATFPNSIVTLNNLAYLWAIQKKNLEEAMKLIDRATLYYGEQLQLRDTRAMIYLAMKQPDKAIADLQAQPNEKPTVVNLFHLAEAQWIAGDQQAAKITFDDAKQQGLVPSLLRTVELEMYQQLNGQL
ncbi:MAG: tetratricopeptide repeat protein, partial [Thermoguttaceae bacterium]|nr:tetratricopeptide repeat protein [Thermoguttaceae bacterium]